MPCVAVCAKAPRVSWRGPIIPGRQRTASKVKQQVQAALAELLDGIHHGNGNIKDHCVGRVRHLFAYEIMNS